LTAWRLTVEYEGTRYSGWQEQKHARTVAGEIRGAAERFFNEKVDLAGAGRTDAGVHALGQVARLTARSHVKPERLLIALNDGLPPDINILKVEKCGQNFDPRRSALLRCYLYQISTRRTAFAKRFVWWVKDRLDVALMKRAANAIVGRHDFAPFCERRGDEISTVVAVERAEITCDGDLILFRIAAPHFLWKMVRRIVGSMVEVGRKELPVGDFADLLDNSASSRQSSSHSVAAHTAPPSGLFLERVIYDRGENIGPLAAAFPVRRV
jgi:tRNA pseudouridine38-40 synthase